MKYVNKLFVMLSNYEFQLKTNSLTAERKKHAVNKLFKSARLVKLVYNVRNIVPINSNEVE